MNPAKARLGVSERFWSSRLNVPVPVATGLIILAAFLAAVLVDLAREGIVRDEVYRNHVDAHVAQRISVCRRWARAHVLIAEKATNLAGARSELGRLARQSVGATPAELQVLLQSHHDEVKDREEEVREAEDGLRALEAEVGADAVAACSGSD